jgi:hypothetical protein
MDTEIDSEFRPEEGRLAAAVATELMAKVPWWLIVPCQQGVVLWEAVGARHE